MQLNLFVSVDALNAFCGVWVFLSVLFSLDTTKQHYYSIYMQGFYRLTDTGKMNYLKLLLLFYETIQWEKIAKSFSHVSNFYTTIMLEYTLIWVLVTSFFSLSLSQCWCGPNGLLHCDWFHVGACEAGEDARYLWSRDSAAISSKLHGADRGAVRLYLWCTAGGCFLRQHRGSGTESLRLHPETVTDGTAGAHQRNGAGI